MFRDFFSEGRYFNLPIIRNRVSLFIDNSKLFKTSIKLYMPSSKKAIIVKGLIKNLNTYFPKILFLFSVKHEKGKFIDFFEKKYKKKIVSSIYYPTISDKLVLQLITLDGNIFGYMKIGTQTKGNEKILRELNAINILTNETNLLNKGYLIDTGKYKDFDYIILKEIEGKNNNLTISALSKIFNELNKDQLFLLKDHPNFIELLENTAKIKQKELNEILKQIRNISNKKYSLVFEHGDLAPWNIFEDLDGNVRLFDFEYFENNGLEFMDKFNYFYQIGTLLKKMNYVELLKFLKVKTQVEEFYNVFAIFLVKKIINKIKEESNYNQELDFLKKVSKKI